MTFNVYPYDPATAPPVPAIASDGTTDALSIAVDIYKFYRVKRTASEVVSGHDYSSNKRYCCIPDEYVSRGFNTTKRVRNSSLSSCRRHSIVDDDDAPALKRTRFNEDPSMTTNFISPSAADNEPSDDEDDSPYFFDATDEEIASLAYFSSQEQSYNDDNQEHESEDEDDFHSLWSNSTCLVTCLSQVDDNDEDDDEDDKESQDMGKNDHHQNEKNDDEDDKKDEDDSAFVLVGDEQFYECAAVEADDELRSKAENPPVPSITIVVLGSNGADNDNGEDFEDEKLYDQEQEQTNEDADEDLSFEVVLGEQYYECNAKVDDEEQSKAKTYMDTTAVDEMNDEYDEEDDSCIENLDDQNKEEEDSSIEVDGGSESCAAKGQEDEEQSESRSHPASIELLGVVNDEDEEQSRAEKCNPRNKHDSSFLEVDGQSQCTTAAEVEDEEQQSEAVNSSPSVPSHASASGTTMELLGLDRVFDDLGNVLTMSSYRLRGLPRKNYKEAICVINGVGVR